MQHALLHRYSIGLYSFHCTVTECITQSTLLLIWHLTLSYPLIWCTFRCCITPPTDLIYSNTSHTVNGMQRETGRPCNTVIRKMQFCYSCNVQQLLNGLSTIDVSNRRSVNTPMTSAHPHRQLQQLVSWRAGLRRSMVPLVRRHRRMPVEHQLSMALRVSWTRRSSPYETHESYFRSSSEEETLSRRVSAFQVTAWSIAL